MYRSQYVSIHYLCNRLSGPWARPNAKKPQQQTLSVRIDDPLRRRLERARQLSASKTGEPVSTSEIAKRFLESARDDRLEVVDLLADPTGSLLQIRRKGEAGLVLSRAEWTTLAHFVRHGVEAVSAQTPHAVSRESLVALLDAFVAVYDLRPDAPVGDWRRTTSATCRPRRVPRRNQQAGPSRVRLAPSIARSLRRGVTCTIRRRPGCR